LATTVKGYRANKHEVFYREFDVVKWNKKSVVIAEKQITLSADDTETYVNKTYQREDEYHLWFETRKEVLKYLLERADEEIEEAKRQLKNWEDEHCRLVVEYASLKDTK